MEFVQFKINCMKDTSTPVPIRDIMERALAAGGLHVLDGNILWEVYINFEKIILNSLKVK